MSDKNDSDYSLNQAQEVEKAFKDLDNDLNVFDQISAELPAIINEIMTD